METGKPILAQATKFAAEVRAAVPHQMLAYNLSPSFNWDMAGMTDAQMESFIWDLAKLGFCWQFITLAGFHCDALSIDLFARDYAKRGAAAYVQLIQRKEREHGVETLKHCLGRHFIHGHHVRRRHRRPVRRQALSRGHQASTSTGCCGCCCCCCCCTS
ncbi:unnamed protein product [Polarella glacialis]|uniref:Isocitrate lyase n=1 Tax=Polarella glacialis TaxID=89957 RepID=A0A813H973_POLGL|nr:unnamed protein product [Polarella glacialis]